MQGDAASPKHRLTSFLLGESVSPVQSQRILPELQLKGFPVALILSLGLVPFCVPVCLSTGWRYFWTGNVTLFIFPFPLLPGTGIHMVHMLPKCDSLPSNLRSPGLLLRTGGGGRGCPALPSPKPSSPTSSHLQTTSSLTGLRCRPACFYIPPPSPPPYLLHSSACKPLNM